MRFLGKYELSEQLTVGSVETFAAYPVGGGERLLVHVFALPAFIKSGLKNSDLLSYMEEMAPPALGAVVDAGRYDDGSQAFIVTKFPRELPTLSKWIEAYKSTSKKKDTTTVEAPVHQLWEGSSGSVQPAATPSGPPVGEFTRAFQSIGPSPEAAKPKSATDAFDSFAPTATTQIVDRAVRLDPYVAPKGELFERTGGLGEGARLPRSSSAAEPLTRAESERGSIGSTGPIPWDASEPPSQEQLPSTARAGEFTMFFKGPLAAPSSASLSDPQPEQDSEPFHPVTRPAKGEFTQMFGGPTAGQSSPLPTEPLLEPPAQGGDFTNIFGRSPASAPPPVVPPLGELQLKAESSDRPIFHEEPIFRDEEDTPQIPFARNMAEPAYPAAPALESSALGRSHDDGATRLFRPPVQEVPKPVIPPGESEYTKIVSAKARPAEPEAAVQKQAPAGGGGAKLSIAVPAALPHFPSMAVPQPIPAVHLPAPPAVSAPKLSLAMPASPKPAKKSGWAAYAPLIVILNLLLLAAVSLVLYFILKH